MGPTKFGKVCQLIRSAVRSTCRRLQHASLLLKSILSVGIVVPTLALIFYLALPRPQIRTVFTGQSESVATIVDFQDVAAFRVGGMRALPDEGDGACVAGLVSPSHDVRVVYQRIGKGEISIGLAFAKPIIADRRVVAHVTGLDRSTMSLEGPHRLKLDPTCAGEPPTRLPLHGNSEFGREFSPADIRRDAAIGYLYSGKILSYARSVEAWWLPTHPRVYRIQDAEVPPGARLKAEPSTAEGDPPVWWGVARIDADQPGFAVEASTNDPNIVVVLAGGANGADRLKIGNAGEITEDPDVVWLFSILAVIGSIIGASEPIAKLLYDHWIRAGRARDDAERTPITDSQRHAAANPPPRQNTEA